MPDRRTFLKQAGALGAGLLLADVGALAMGRSPEPGPGFRPVRIRGRVHVGGKGLSRVAVSDGLSVAATDDDGRFVLLSSNRRRFVHVGLPTGCAIPTNPTGTARFYEPIVADRKGEMQVEFSLVKNRLDETEHHFFAMADPQTQTQGEILQLRMEAVPDIAAASRARAGHDVFGVSCGDIVYDHLNLFTGYERAVSEMGIPCFQVVGNHDCEIGSATDEDSVRTFERHFGPTYYSFDRGEIHYVVLDDIFWFGGYIGYLDRTQLDWLAADLALLEPGRRVVLFMHIPVHTETWRLRGDDEPSHRHVIVNRELLHELLDPYEATAVCGHMHFCEFLREGGIDIHTVGALCGAWWTGPVCYDGTPKGYMIYTARGRELSRQYKPVGGTVEQQLRVYPRGADPEHPDAIVANVWGADDDWTVRCIADGAPLGPMTRYDGLDPLAVELYAGDARPEKHTWVDPVVTGHLYHATPPTGVNEVVVEARDPWGRSYTERIAI